MFAKPKKAAKIQMAAFLVIELETTTRGVTAPPLPIVKNRRTTRDQGMPHHRSIS